MRMIYQTRTYDFGQESSAQTPKRICLHRQGNLGAKALNALDWGKRTGAFTIHSYVSDAVCYDAIMPDRHAFHVLAAGVAAQKGYRTTGAYGLRGDYDSIGIETEDVAGGAPGQAYSLTQETRITLLLRTAAYLRQFGLSPDAVDEHATYDPTNRPDDLGDALHIPDFREDLRDLMAGRTPWRTVGQYATGGPAPLSWKPAGLDVVSIRLEAGAMMASAQRILDILKEWS